MSGMANTKYRYSLAEVHNEDYDYEEDNRLLGNIPIPQDYLFAMLIISQLKTERGQAFLERISKEYFATLRQTMAALAQAGSGNIITAYSHSLIISNMLEHNHMIHKNATRGLADAVNWLVASEQGQNWIKTIFGEGGFNVPSTITFAPTDNGGGEASGNLSALTGLAKLIGKV